ncbi:hypothetical protein NIES3585_37480 [Nodularia sp. NIES-3585]|nr:hypothetical protein NIES3585_37480 [Nodularia sp. NIES-3585]
MPTLKHFFVIFPSFSLYLCTLRPKALGAYAARMRYALRARYANVPDIKIKYDQVIAVLG